MERIILTDIPFAMDLEALAARLHVEPGGPFWDDLKALAEAGTALARPKVVYGMAAVGHTGDEAVTLEGVPFHSRILRVNLDGTHRAFVYVATCGTEMEDWAEGLDDILERFWADALMEQALSVARRALDADVQARFSPGKVSRMSPGSLADWPLPQQVPLFQVLAPVTETVGVRLTESFLMLPAKSVSGLLFRTEESYENCMLCPREECPGRRATYDPGMMQRRYAEAGGH